MGMSSEAFDRLKEAHFLRDVGLPAVGSLDPVVWFGIFWLVGMVLGFVATAGCSSALRARRAEGGHDEPRSAAPPSSWWRCSLRARRVDRVAIAALLGVFFARDLAGPLYTIWLNEQISDSSVRATVLSITGQANAIGQAGGGPVLGSIGNVWGIRPRSSRALRHRAGARPLRRASAPQGREPELELPPGCARLSPS